MKRLVLLILVVSAAAVIALQADATATPTIDPQESSAFSIEAPVFNPDGVDTESECVAEGANMGQPCEKQCEKQRKRCVRQGNGETYCYDNVFCTCMCDTCNNCIC